MKSRYFLYCSIAVFAVLLQKAEPPKSNWEWWLYLGGAASAALVTAKALQSSPNSDSGAAPKTIPAAPPEPEPEPRPSTPSSPSAPRSILAAPDIERLTKPPLSDSP